MAHCGHSPVLSITLCVALSPLVLSADWWLCGGNCMVAGVLTSGTDSVAAGCAVCWHVSPFSGCAGQQELVLTRY